jgi:hypothetical protein
MKNNWMALGVAAVIALVLEWFGWWWAMPIAGLVAGWMLASGKRGFLLGGLGVTLAWLVYIGVYAVTSPLQQLLVVFSGILGLSASLSFVPVLLALIVAFVLGGLGGLTGGLVAQARR